MIVSIDSIPDSQIKKNPEKSIILPAARNSPPPTSALTSHDSKLQALLQPLQKAPQLLINLTGRLLQAAPRLLGATAAGSAHLAGRALPVLVVPVVVIGGSVDLVVDVVAGGVGGVVGMVMVLVLVLGVLGLVVGGGLLRVGVLWAVVAWCCWWAGLEVVCVLGLKVGQGLVWVWS
jgi:hypothetical protein